MSYGSSLVKAVKATRLTQPYRRGARSPGPVLDAMRAGSSSAAPGSALMEASASSRRRNSAIPSYEPMGKVPNPGRRRRTIKIPRM